MIYLSGSVRADFAGWLPHTAREFGQLAHRRRHPEYEHWSDAGDGIGFMCTPRMGNRPVPDVVWAADTGCFSDPERFDLDRYVRWLGRRDPRTCLFATAPDWPPMPQHGVPGGDWCATLDRFEETAPAIRAAGYRVALVAQSGLECYLGQLEYWFWRGDVDAIFLGGDTRWKVSEAAADVVRSARHFGLWCHMGRCNSARRIRLAYEMGCDSADGTFLAHAGAGALGEVLRWLRPLSAQLTLPIAA
jgi:hypothetical protein